MASPELEPSKEIFRAFYIAFIQAKICRGIQTWWFAASPSDKEKIERLHARAAYAITSVPTAAYGYDMLKYIYISRLCAVWGPVVFRAVKYYLGANKRFPLSSPIYNMLGRVSGMYTHTDDLDKPHTMIFFQRARRPHFNLSTPEGLLADAWVGKKTMVHRAENELILWDPVPNLGRRLS